MTPTPDIDIGELRRLLDLVTHSKWERGSHGHGRTTTVYCGDVTGSAVADCAPKYVHRSTVECEANAASIAALRNAAPALLAKWEECDDLQATFDLRWKADMRAIERWRAAGEGRELTMPDHADLCVWLLDRLAAAEAVVSAVREWSLATDGAAQLYAESRLNAALSTYEGKSE